MRLLMALLAAAGLAGCVAYPYGEAPGYYGGAPYYQGSVYYGTSAPYVVEQPAYAVRERRRHWGGRDRDGDGVPNWRDAHPNNPRRY